MLQDHGTKNVIFRGANFDAYTDPSFHLISNGPFPSKSYLRMKRAANLTVDCGEMISKYY